LRVTQSGDFRSEWIKLRSLRSTWSSLLVAVLVMDGLGTLFAGLHAHRMHANVGPGSKVVFDATQVSLRGVFLAQLAVGVLGVLVISGEYATGMIRSSLAAEPRRLPVLVAKAGTFAAAVLVVSLVGTFAAFLLGQAAQSSTHAQAHLDTPGAVRAILAAAVYLTLLGLLAVGLGFLLRNTAAAIAALFGIVLVAPLLVNTLPTPYSTDIARFLPLNTLNQAISTIDRDPNLYGAWTGIGITAAWAAAALIGGAVVLLRRDA
jgi:ABC-type transport system involved in multi-copper enzyme maturation permease subunit